MKLTSIPGHILGQLGESQQREREATNLHETPTTEVSAFCHFHIKQLQPLRVLVEEWGE